MQMWIFLLLFVIFLGKVHHGCGFGSMAFRTWGQNRSLKLLSRFLSYITIYYYSIETRDKGLDQQHSEFEDRDGPWSSWAGSSHILPYITILLRQGTRDKGLDQQHSEFEDRIGLWTSWADSSLQQGRRRPVERCQTQFSRAGIWWRNYYYPKDFNFFLNDSKQIKCKNHCLSFWNYLNHSSSSLCIIL